MILLRQKMLEDELAREIARISYSQAIKKEKHILDSPLTIGILKEILTTIPERYNDMKIILDIDGIEHYVTPECMVLNPLAGTMTYMVRELKKEGEQYEERRIDGTN